MKNKKFISDTLSRCRVETNSRGENILIDKYIGKICYLKSEAIEQATQQPLNGKIVKITRYEANDKYTACIDFAKKEPTRFVSVSLSECDFAAWEKLEQDGFKKLFG